MKDQRSSCKYILNSVYFGLQLVTFRCSVPFSECITEDHTPSCRCKENFHGNGTDVCIPMGFDTEDNKRGYRMFDEEYMEWDNATQKCQELGARLPVLSDVETIKIVKKYLDTADFDVFEVVDNWLKKQISLFISAMGQIKQTGMAGSAISPWLWANLG